ncbi:MAG: NAD(P)/FAD-dependent oxidoreductase [Deltaproteobacteria bacterium]|jgi:dihydrolipoamide dehydrogenase|nr:NAD(P)/FAD-dependent oxidoreductase [Deltaproteobacteria bacterium]MBW2533460.1 NAD(P)/FAD-dependent oxidoreductase [Deltaproteobacteria bacterium]
MTAPLQLVVLGAGPAGIAAALEGARFGARVTLVTDGQVGGRAGWHSLLPSKVLLHAAERRAAGSDRLAAEPFRQLIASIEPVAQQYNGLQAGRLAKTGVRVVTGKAAFESEHKLVVRGADVAVGLNFDRVIVTTGSVPVFPEGLRPDGECILAPRFVRKLTRLPESMCVIGGGATGTEFAYAFAAFGVEVTWLVDQYGVLPTFDRRATRPLVDVLTSMGVNVVKGRPAASVAPVSGGVEARLDDGQSFRAEMGFLALGRRPDVSDLNLPAVGLEPAGDGPAKGGIAVDELGRTAARHVFAAGDVTGGPFVANKAKAQARAAARAALDRPVAPVRPDTWVQAVYTHPQVAQVGVTPEQSQRRRKPTRTLAGSYEGSLKGQLEHETAATSGFLELCIDIETDAIIGACAFGPGAADVLTPVAMAIRSGATTDTLADIFPAHPTISELPFLCVR